MAPVGTGFQSFVNTQPAPAVAGDFASANPRYSVDAGPGGLAAGALGLTIGRAAWLSAQDIDANGAPSIANNFGSGPIAGIVPREQQGLIRTYLDSAGMVLPAGFQTTVISGADMWVVNDGTTEALFGQFAYANYADGRFSFAAASSPGTAVVTGAVAASTASVTGSIDNDILTVTAVGSGVVVPGATISGTGIATGTKIVGQELPLDTGEALGGIGRYALSIPEQTAASTTVSMTYGTMTVSAVTSGVLGVGDTLSGSGVTAGTAITALGTGTGGAGTYIVNNNAVVASTTITAGTSIQTKWIAMSSALPGELVKISSQPLG